VVVNGLLEKQSEGVVNWRCRRYFGDGGALFGLAVGECLTSPGRCASALPWRYFAPTGHYVAYAG
jgi:hypothetical protein